MASRATYLSTCALLGLVGALGASPACAQSVTGQAPGAETGASASATEKASIEEIVVTGTRISGGFTAPTPVTVVGQQQITARGPATVLEALNETPAFRPALQTSGNSRNSSAQYGIQGLVDLRGLGVSRTLVLFDGQRFVAGGIAGAPDSNMFPTGLIDRVEVVTGGASAAYGSDAVAGVVNFILKDRMEGFTASASSGISNYGDGRQLIASLAGGVNFADDRAHLVASFDHAENHGIPNIYSRSYGQVEPGLVGTGTVGSATRPAGTPANLWVENLEVANATFGGLITGSTTATGAASTLLRGIAFDNAGQQYPFQFGSLYGGGATMTGSTANYGNNPQGYFPLGNRFSRNNGYGKLTYELGGNTSLWVSGVYGKVSQQSIASGPTSVMSTFQVDLTNPYLPANIRAAMVANNLSRITVGKIFDIGGTHISQTNESWRIAGGAKGKIGDWSWDVYATHGRTSQDYSFTGLLTGNAGAAAYAQTVNGTVVCGPLATNPNLTAATRAQVQAGCAPFNVFGNTTSPQALDYIFNDIYANIRTRQTAGAFNLRGSPIDLWAGPLVVAVGVEARRESLASIVTDPLSIAAYYNSGNQAPYSGSDSVKEGYLELGLPLIDNANGPFLTAANINAAGRITDYHNSGTVETWKLGATADLVDGLRVRATRSRDIRAPNLYEQFGANPGTQSNNVTNPFNGTVGTLPVVTSRGSQNLDPEVASTLTAGIIVTPHGFLRGLRASVDFFNIKVKKGLATVGVQETINGCFRGNAEYCSRIDRITPSALGIYSVANSPSNLNRIHTRGIDIELAYSMPTLPIPGHLDLRLLGTYTDTFKLTTPATTLEYAGSAATISGALINGGGSPRYRWQLTATYGVDSFTSQFRVNGFTKLIYSPSLLGPGQDGYDPTSSTSISQNVFSGRTYVGWTGTVDVKTSDKFKMQMFSVINNLLNTKPPRYAINAFSFNTANYYDVVGRTYQVGVRIIY